jgi:hypothetical protein
MKKLLKVWYWCQRKVRAVLPAIQAFLPRVLPGRKKTAAFLKRVFLILAMMLLMCPVIMRTGGSMNTGLPVFTTTASYTLVDDGDKNWRLKFLTSGTIRFSRTFTIDVFVVGGGAGGGAGRYGGGGGYTTTQSSVVIQADVDYAIVVGAGGAVASVGNASSAFGVSANGGGTVNGGSGGGAGSSWTANAGGNGGSNGSDGADVLTNLGGEGQGTTTREFAEATGVLYAGAGGGGTPSTSLAGGTGGSGGGGRGGNAGTITPLAGTANTGGGGGGGGSAGVGAAGGSGIVIIRNHRAAA